MFERRYLLKNLYVVRLGRIIKKDFILDGFKSGWNTEYKVEGAIYIAKKKTTCLGAYEKYILISRNNYVVNHISSSFGCNEGDFVVDENTVPLALNFPSKKKTISKTAVIAFEKMINNNGNLNCLTEKETKKLGKETNLQL